MNKVLYNSSAALHHLEQFYLENLLFIHPPPKRFQKNIVLCKHKCADVVRNVWGVDYAI